MGEVDREEGRSHDFASKGVVGESGSPLSTVFSSRPGSGNNGDARGSRLFILVRWFWYAM